MERGFLRKPDQVNGELTQFFEDNGFEVSWDYDKFYEWIEIYENGKILMQIESKVTIDQFIDLLVRDYESRQKGIFFDPGFFVASNLFDDDETALEFCNRFELFRNRIK